VRQRELDQAVGRDQPDRPLSVDAQHERGREQAAGGRRDAERAAQARRLRDRGLRRERLRQRCVRLRAGLGHVPPLHPPAPALGCERGWDTCRNYIRESRRSEAGHVCGDALEAPAEHTKKRPDRPCFLYLQTIDPHVVYRVDKKYWSPYFEGAYDGPLGSAIE